MSKKLRIVINEIKEFAELNSKNPHFTGFEEEQEKFLAWIEDLGTYDAGQTDHKISEINLFASKVTRAMLKAKNTAMAIFKARKKELNANAAQ